ncbi:hypothetical protein N7494_012116 [Penicillium frequentans]|uniref:Methyltransferase domain-containing protein n=1 Tax=Penicillium frequentans TaxID=3151616 RepID=A0AAD6CLJ1_9EURO|nr:hypothetical protein N7494_012116 [Penicillium glabrum]
MTSPKSSEPKSECDTQSLTDSVTDYPVENGRRYHKYHEGAYLYPNDEQELDRLDMAHHMYKLVTKDKLYHVPLEKPQQILDVGTGSGIWPIDMATIFPNTTITGTDLSPVQPTEVPENVHFLVDDATEEEWLWDADHFDFIHVAHMSGAIASFKQVLQQSFKHLKPGGYIECQETDPKPRCDDGTMPPENPDGFSTYALHDWFDLNMRSSQEVEPCRQFRIAHRLEKWMKEVGFVDVEQRKFKVPTNNWPTDERLKVIGEWSKKNWLEALSGWSYKPFLALGWSKPEIEVFLVDACLQACSKTPSASTLDHPWVSDDLLAATFRRFASGQRRHGSCVPGPLEARRRLARRRNTALAGFGLSPAEDIACLFGRNGREHMKWTDHPWQRSHADTQDLSSYAYATAETSLPFYDHNPEPITPRILESKVSTSREGKEPTKAQVFQQYLEGKDWGIEDARDFARQLRIDLHREPKYSRQIFDRLLMRSTTDLTQAIQFLDDPYLNVWGAGNYLAAVDLFVRTKTKRSNRTAVLNAVSRALELGLVASDEICLIIKALPDIIVERNKTLAAWDQKALLKHYRAMWQAIGRCNILGYGELDKEIVDTWLEELMRIGDFRFAGEIIVATHNASHDTHWPSTFIFTWLHEFGQEMSTKSVQFPSSLLNRLDPDCAANCLIDVTERLASIEQKQDRNQRLEQWRDCLLNITDASAIARSQIWSDLVMAYTSNQNEALAAFPTNSSLPIQHQIVLRLWVLRSLSRSMGPMYHSHAKATDRSIYMLLSLYEITVSQTKGTFLADLLHDIHGLNLPYSGLLLLAVDLKERKLVTKTTRQTLERLETSQISLANLWADPATYNGVRGLFYGSFEQMFNRLDLLSPETMNECLRLARVGDSKSVWSITRLLGNHTPFKLCLHKAWVPIPHPDEKVLVRYHPGPRDSRCPDPYAAVDFIHQLAVALSCCQQLTPSRSFHLIHWLYDYLRKHGGPVYPSLVRAMYHAGVVRYRREGRRISRTQYEYIMWIIEKFEGQDVVRELHEAPQIGRSSQGSYHD